MAETTSIVTKKNYDQLDGASAIQVDPKPSNMTVSAVSQCQESKSKQVSLESFVMNDTNLTNLSILNEFEESSTLETSADLQLRFQRLLAESSLENSIVFNNVSSDKSVQQGENLEDEFLSGTSTPRLRNSIFANNFGAQDSQKKEEFESLFKKYFSEDFVPAENAMDRLMADEIAWKKEFGISSPDKEKLQVSCFSGILGDAEISLRSVGDPNQEFKNKVRAEEYFNMKTDKIGSLNNVLSNAERPNFGHEIQSPNVNRPHVAFVQESLTDNNKRNDLPNDLSQCDNYPVRLIHTSNIEEIDLNTTPSEKSCSTLSVTSIEDILSKHLQDTPGTIARSILNPKAKIKPIYYQDTSASSVDEYISSLSAVQEGNNKPKMTEWINLELHQREFDTHVGSNIEIEIHIQNQSTRWLKCNVIIDKIVHNNTLDTLTEKEMMTYINLPDVTLVGPNQKTIQMIKVTPIIAGALKIHVNVIAEDAVTQTSKNYTAMFEISSKMPKVEILVGEDIKSEVDFGILPECSSQSINLEIRNYSDANLPLNIEMEEVSNSPHTFFLHQNKIYEKLHPSSQEKKKSLNIGITFETPCIENSEDTVEGLIHFSAYLNVAIVFPGVRSSLLKKLKLKGCVGITKLLINFRSPIELSSSGPGIPNSKVLSFKNGGCVPLHIKLLIVDPKTSQMESSGIIVINNPTLRIQPEKEASVSLVFTPLWIYEECIERKLLVHVSPDDNILQIDILAKMEDGCRGQNKERLSYQSCDTISTTSSSSVGSGKSMPVQTTHKQLVWTTIPTGKSQMQCCRLRNDCAKPVKVHLTMSDNGGGFWMLNENGEHTLERTLKLHAKECIPLNVVFSPSKVGVAHGKIVIRETRRDTDNKFAIPLSGYGGTFYMSIRNIPKDKSGHMWINLGPFDCNLRTHFTLCNRGNLESFFYIKYIPKGIGALLQDFHASIEPSKALIAPGSKETIQVSFRLQNEFSFISKDDKDVLELGILYVVCGDEASRQRIRRIRNKSKSNLAANKVLDLDDLCSSFPRETCLSELSALNDPESAMRSLYRCMQQHEVTVTVEKADDQSLAMQTHIGNGQLGNESLVFKSMLADCTSSLQTENSNDKDTSCSWKITPLNLTLLLPRFASGCLTIASTYKEDQMFEVCSTESFLSVDPSSGILSAMGETVLVVTCNPDAVKTNSTIKSTLKIYLENDVKTITVHIKHATENLFPLKKLSALNSGIEQKNSK